MPCGFILPAGLQAVHPSRLPKEFTLRERDQLIRALMDFMAPPPTGPSH